jgi:hypothetical protein
LIHHAAAISFPDCSLLEAIAVRCAICLGRRGDAETDDERAETTLSTAVEVTFSARRPKRLFVLADRLTAIVW